MIPLFDFPHHCNNDNLFVFSIFASFNKNREGVGNALGTSLAVR